MTSPATARTATVEVLTAEVRVLMVGSRQITLSVYRQLDWVSYDKIEPFGRVNDGAVPYGTRRIYVVGSAVATGDLVRAQLELPDAKRWNALKRLTQRENADSHFMPTTVARATEQMESAIRLVPCWESWKRLPLIVLAGLK